MSSLFYRRNRVVISLSALLMAGAGLAGAQANVGAISGTVTDTSGAIVPHAIVTVRNEATSETRNLTTDDAGFYSAEGLATGKYDVSVLAPGFAGSNTEGLQLDPGQRRANNIKLSVGAATEQVSVIADALQINTESSESGGTINAAQIDKLMLNGRNFQTLAIAIPGVSSTNRADALGGGGLAGGTTLIVNGNSVEYTTYTIDGIYNMNSGNLANINILPVVDGIAEFSVLKDSYSAKYGFAGSGQVVVSTKTGSQTFNGSAWDYIRNNKFDSRNYFSTVLPRRHQNIYGYTLGGPVIIPHLYNTDRSKQTFFFASTQWQKISAGSTIRAAVFPQALRNGDFSHSPTLSGPLQLDAHSTALLASQGRTNCIVGPKALNPNCFDPVSVSLLNAYVPLPNNPGGGFLNYINQDPQVTTQIDHQYRIDHQIREKHQLTGRLMYEQTLNAFPNDSWSGTPFNNVTDSFYTTGLNAFLRVQSSITPRFLSTTSIAETYDRPRISLLKGAGTLPSGVSIQQAFPNAPSQNRIPNISFSEGYAGFGVGSQPITASDGEGIATEDVSLVRGQHVFQAGAVYMFGIKRQTVFSNPQGSFSFSGVHTGDPAADYLLGLNSSYSQASSERVGVFHYRQGEVYLQDDWKATPRLTLNLGVRWVYFSNDTVSGSEVTSFLPSAYDSAQAPVVTPQGKFVVNNLNQPLTASGAVASQVNGLVFAGQNGTPHGFFIPKKTNIGPRVGFAYDLSGKGTTSLRGGYGNGYSRIPLAAIYYAFGANPPYNQSANILNSLISDGTAGGTAAAPTPQSLNGIPPAFRPTSLQTYSLTLEQQVRKNLVASVAYAGSQTRHLTTGVGGGNDINFPLPVSTPSADACLASGQVPSTSYDFDPCINAGVSSADYTRPYQGYSGINYQYDEGSANYNSLQSAATYHSGGSQLSVAYTYSKSLATVAPHGAGNGTSQSAGPQNPRNFAAEYGPPSYDFTHDVTVTGVYQLPLLERSNEFTRQTLGGWSVAGLFLHQSGFALSPGLNTGESGLAARPNLVHPYRKLGQVAQYFDTTTFAAPAFGFFGNAGNGIIRGPAYTSINASLYKSFPLHERLDLQLRAEAFNLLNHPNFTSVDTGVGSGTYGRITGAGDPRIMEFAVKLNF